MTDGQVIEVANYDRWPSYRAGQLYSFHCIFGEILGSYGGKYEDDYPDDGSSKNLSKVSKLLPDSTAQHPRTQSSSSRI
jgi:hypothetical protein